MNLAYFVVSALFMISSRKELVFLSMCDRQAHKSIIFSSHFVERQAHEGLHVQCDSYFIIEIV